jgi:hypothetical protein
MKLTYISDPGHGWIRVPVSLIFDLGIENQISNYSFVSPSKKRWAYLEEDKDAQILISELQKQGIRYYVKFPLSSSTNKYSPIRNYPRWMDDEVGSN